MKKIIFLSLIFLLTIETYSQISVSSKHVGSVKKFKPEILNRFKQSKTLFILPEIFKKEEYEKILNEVWTVTPFEIVNKNKFKYEDYFEDGYSFLELNAPPKVSYSFTGASAQSYKANEYIIDLYLFDNDKIKSKLPKISSNKKKNYKIRELLIINKIHLAKIHLYIDNTTFKMAVKSIDKYKDEKILPSISFASLEDEDVENFKTILNTKNIFYNFELGYFKNYLQRVNFLIEKEKTYWLYESDYQPELKNLANSTLYIPEFITYEAVAFHKPFAPFVSPKNNEVTKPETRDLKKLLKDYEFDYSKISSKELNEKILDGKEVYYLRYVPTLSGERFLQVVNSKTGEDLYRLYLKGFTTDVNLKSKNIKDLNKAVKKALKK